MSEETTGETPATEQSAPQEFVQPADQNAANERAAFKTYVESNGQQVPENFKDVDTWFDSLKNAQAEYTKTRQEIAELKDQYAKTGQIGERSQPVQEEQQPAEVVQTREDLRIEKPEEPPQLSMNDQWAAWQQELALSGDFSADTRGAIKSAMGVDDAVVDTFIAGQKALRKEAYDSAANVVGDQQTLDNILSWAGESLNDQERDDLNSMLAGPSYKTALLGLQARYNQEQANKPNRRQEPAPVQGRENAAMAQDADAIKPFSTTQEMNFYMNKPEYRTDPEYRAQIEARLVKTMQAGVLIR
tara:strand:+ start:2552 stop:3457 length:906 start_codon:yes stop_codon:yes gene_type:complete